ncbi:muscarinic acetylcholine receptor M1-like [Osmerus mordax]|uniref:muscarinic acetylcholine receptor M1-like n=1 Tax=Osmerus mordax TaxID=8014 RepID=UPI00350F6C77
MNNCVSQTSNRTADPLEGHEVWEVLVIVIITVPLSLVTILGNLLVLISFRVNSQLRTVSNYFLLSLAVADLILGAVSMNLYAAYIIMGRWALGSVACDLWLAVDYVASNASVMNLLVISFDRFYSVTRPLTYRVKRTTQRAVAAIVLAWAVSFVLWGPAILFWPHVVGRASELQDSCSIPFMDDAVLTFGTAIAAFYLPVTIMVILYWKIYWEIEQRSQGREGLLGSVSSAGGPQGSGGRSVYSSSTKSSSSSAREGPGGKDPCREASQGRGSAKPSLPPTTGSNGEGCAGSRGAEGGRGSTASLSSDEEEAPDTAPPPGDPPALRVEDLRGRQPSLRGSSLSESRRTRQPKARRRRNRMITEKKAARTLSAILLAFILTWSPYNIMVLASFSYCVPEKLWQLGYWLCYINSTVNPICYALCNKHFRVTFKSLLLCRLGQRDWGRTRHGNHATTRMQRTGSTVRSPQDP